MEVVSAVAPTWPEPLGPWWLSVESRRLEKVSLGKFAWWGLCFSRMDVLPADSTACLVAGPSTGSGITPGTCACGRSGRERRGSQEGTLTCAKARPFLQLVGRMGLVAFLLLFLKRGAGGQDVGFVV